MADNKTDFTETDAGDLPSFDICQTILDMTLHILWASKEAGIRRLSSREISSILLDAHEVSIETKRITQALKNAGNRIHVHREDRDVLYEIMKAGKEYLRNLRSEGTLEILYFQPGQRYTSKRLLSVNILNSLTGETKIVDPYCGERTLDVILEIKNRPIKFLTKIEILQPKARERFLRELKEFKIENPDIEFREYPYNDLHDRYIISSNNLTLLGHSIKDLGSKESFAVALTETNFKNTYDALRESFDRRWKQSNPL